MEFFNKHKNQFLTLGTNFCKYNLLIKLDCLSFRRTESQLILTLHLLCTFHSHPSACMLQNLHVLSLLPTFGLKVTFAPFPSLFLEPSLILFYELPEQIISPPVCKISCFLISFVFDIFMPALS